MGMAMKLLVRWIHAHGLGDELGGRPDERRKEGDELQAAALCLHDGGMKLDPHGHES
jgi:hypothetical protein